MSAEKHKIRNLLVESEADAKAAKAADVAGFVGTMDLDSFPLTVGEAMRGGSRSITLLFNSHENEPPEERDYRIRELTWTAVKMEAEVEISEISAQSVAAYLLDHSGEELLQHITRTKKLASNFLSEMILKRYRVTHEALASFNSIRRDFLELTDRFRFSPKSLSLICNVFADNFGGNYISDGVIDADVSRRLQEAHRAEARAKAARLLKDIGDATLSDDTEKAREMAASLSSLLAETDADKYRQYLAPNSLADTKAAYRNRPQGIRTGYYLDCEVPNGRGGNDIKPTEDTELILPAAAITFIAAPTSHGKTTLLQNLALRAARDGGGAVLYLSYEESVEDITTEFLTLHIATREQETGGSNDCPSLRTVRDYYTQGERETAIRGSDDRGRKVAELIRRHEPELESILRDGRLRIFKPAPDVSELTGLVTALNEATKVKAVFVDYIQILHKRGNFGGQKKSEISAICDDLRELVTTTKLPIVIGAQVNRQALSPLDMENQNVADASDIEHAADTMVLLWNSSYSPLGDCKHYAYERAKGKEGETVTDYDKPLKPRTMKAESLGRRGLMPGESGKMYAHVTKCRGAARGLDAVWTFQGSVRLITSSRPEASGKTEAQKRAEAEASGKIYIPD